MEYVYFSSFLTHPHLDFTRLFIFFEKLQHVNGIYIREDADRYSPVTVMVSPSVSGGLIFQPFSIDKFNYRVSIPSQQSNLTQVDYPNLAYTVSHTRFYCF